MALSNLDEESRSSDSLGVLCLHGLLSSPAFLRETAAALSGSGFQVACPTLPGHGTAPEDLEGTTRHDWIRSAESALGVLQARCKHVFVLGHSMGSTLAIHLAARHRELSGIVLLAPSVTVSRRVRLTISLLSRWRRWLPNGPLAVEDPQARSDTTLHGYPRIPLRALRENLALKAEAHTLLAQVSVPALLVEGYFDRLVAPGSARAIAETLGSPEKSVLTAFRSSHGLPVDFDRDWVHQAAIAFMLGRIRQPL